MFFSRKLQQVRDKEGTKQVRLQTDHGVLHTETMQLNFTLELKLPVFHFHLIIVRAVDCER